MPVVPPQTGNSLRSWQHRLDALRWSGGIWGWCIPLVIGIFAALLRLDGLSQPQRLMFDETYYAKDAYALLLNGYEVEWPEETDEDFAAGNPRPLTEPNYVVHPPLGKWLIAIGIRLFGLDSALGWRFSSAIAGALAVVLIAYVAQRMFRSVTIGALAGTLSAIDGHHLVLSRVALLDIFLMLFLLGAFAALLADRGHNRARLAAWAAQRSSPSATLASGSLSGASEGRKSALLAGKLRRRQGAHWPAPLFDQGPVLFWRPWRFLAAVLLGCAVGVKLSALSFVLVFALMMLLWDASARRALGVARPWKEALLHDTPPAFLVYFPLIILTYIASWSGWIFSSGGWGRNWSHENPASGVFAIIPDWLRSLVNYHVSATGFHADLDSEHLYASHPGTWLFMGRPVSMHYRGVERGETYSGTGETCGADECVSAVLDIANPLIWWTGLIAVVVVLALWLGRRDWRYGAILSGYVAGYLVWFLFPDRTMFFFYTISFHPFVILAICAVAVLVLRAGTSQLSSTGVARSVAERNWAWRRNHLLLLCFVLLCLGISLFYWPLWTGELIPKDSWDLRMWIQSWI